MTDDFRTLEGMLEALWQRLERGLHDTDAPARTLALATSGPDGAAVRLVVLRGLDRSAATLTFYTHTHSPKIAQLKDDPRAELLLWDPNALFQVRLSAHVSMKPGSANEWDGLTRGARLNYATDPLPGTLLHDPDANTPTPDPALLTILTASIGSIDLLHLGALPHARARFSREDDFTGRWIAP